MNYSILKKARVILALLFFSITILSFTDIYELLPDSIISKIIYIQFMPSLLKFVQVIGIASTGFLVILLLTLLAGRIYCSAICPLGILQDFFTSIAKKRSKKKRYFKFKLPFTKTRYGILLISIISFILSFSIILAFVDPYSNAGRIFTYNFKPLIVWANNAVAGILQNQKIYTLKIIELAQTSLPIVIYTILFLIGLAYFSYKRGRLFCNVICPVGTLLGVISKKSIFKIQLNSDSCTKCGRCAGACKSECIDIKNQEIDYSRCVVCFDCLPVCKDNAIDFKSKTKPTEKKLSSPNEKTFDRRSAISTMLMITAGTTVLAQIGQGTEKVKKTGNKQQGEYSLSLKENPVTPPGSKSLERFNSLCTACGLCISACPTNVLQPAIKEYGLKGFMQPHMDYAHTGFCNFDCNRCGEICPTGAILLVPIKEKQLTQLGKAVFVKNNCVVYREGTACGACSEHCPTKAVDMVPYRNGLVIPHVNQDICIGCGACEHPCPVEYPYKAIYVEGNTIHQMAQKPVEEKSLNKTLEEDFPF